ncbi:hypothetical protein AB2I31_26605 (plasmid) [Escherichia coli]
MCFILCFIVLWPGLFIWLFSQIRKKRHDVRMMFNFGICAWWILMAVSCFSVRYYSLE